MSIKSFVISGCSAIIPRTATLVHPTTKETAECSARGPGRALATTQLDSCIKEYQAKGYVLKEQ